MEAPRFFYMVILLESISCFGATGDRGIDFVTIAGYGFIIEICVTAVKFWGLHPFKERLTKWTTSK